VKPEPEAGRSGCVTLQLHSVATSIKSYVYAITIELTCEHE